MQRFIAGATVATFLLRPVTSVQTGTFSSLTCLLP
jgi:hypothetical protein